MTADLEMSTSQQTCIFARVRREQEPVFHTRAPIPSVDDPQARRPRRKRIGQRANETADATARNTARTARAGKGAGVDGGGR